jgi:hypothetical protein
VIVARYSWPPVRSAVGFTQIQLFGAASVSCHSTALAPCGVVTPVVTVPGIDPTPFSTGPCQSS